MSGRLVPLLAGCAAAALLLGGCGRREDKDAPATVSADASPAGTVIIPPDSPKLREIRVGQVVSQAVPTDEIVSPGKIEVNPNRVSRIVLPVTGRITSVLVGLGDAVRQGQPLLAIESPDADSAQSAYLQAQAAVIQARANMVKAQADYDRASDLFAHNAVARKEVLNTENALVQAKAGVEQAQAAQEQAARRISILGLKPGAFGQKVTISAPLSGKVLEMSVVPGEYRTDTNAPVITIADLGTVWVSSDVPESYIRFVQVGEPVDVTLTAYPGEVFRARVTRIADTVDPQTRTIKVRAELNNPRGRLRPEMFGNIRHTEGTQVVPVVPVGAVMQTGGRTVVYLEEQPGRFRQVPVTVGKRSGGVLPILAGLKPGDRVVVDGVMLLKAP